MTDSAGCAMVQVLLELSMMKQGDEATAIITQCIEKLEKYCILHPEP